MNLFFRRVFIFLIFILLTTFPFTSFGNNKTSAIENKSATTTSSIKIGYVDYNNHPSDDFSWYYVDEGFEENDYEKHMICVVDTDKVKWMNLNGADLSLKLIKTTQHLESEKKGSTFYELYSAGSYRLKMYYTATYDPSLDNKGLMYDVKIIVMQGKNKISKRCKCFIME
ncbi:MAG: hypothetical protein KA015_06935 [Spirochaetes bacterium]|nr:hypothetical protein [Spirochaetota bacterium]